jgi:predicted secreted protein
MRSFKLFCLMVLAILPIGAAHAGDASDLNILGFSADGGIFAFEEYGVQDGSGFPFANRFYIDTAKDTFIAGSPVRIIVEDEGATVDAARAAAKLKGEAIISDTILAANRGYTAAMNPVSELSADPFRVVANSSALYPQPQDPMEFRLEEVPLNNTVRCQSFGETNGFRLTRIDARDGGTTRLLHEDKSVPESRGCPVGYRIGAVQTFFPDSAPAVVVVLLAVRSFGFEGPDFRWLALATEY